MSCCSSCGAPIPDGQGICSMCYGDPFYGNDGYYQEWLRQLEQEEYQKQMEIEQQIIEEQIQKDNEQ